MKHSIQKRGWLFLTGISLILAFQNCSGSGDGNSGASQACQDCELDPGLIDTKPKINCEMREASGTQALLRVITSTSNSQSASRAFEEGEEIQIDCSRSTAYDGSSVRSLAVTSQSSDVQITRLDESRFRARFNRFGNYTLSFSASDFSGESITKFVETRVMCSSTAAPRPSMTAASLQVSRGSAEGYFNYSLTAGASAGTPPFQYSWDFNGDGAFDLYRTSPNSPEVIWSSATSIQNVFNHYFFNSGALSPSRRTVRVAVTDACNFVETREFPNVQFDNFARESLTSFPVIRGYHYLEAEVRSTESSESVALNRIKNVDLISHAPQSSPDNRVHVKCNYDITFEQAQNLTHVTKRLEIDSRNHYGPTSNDSLRHGLYVQIDNVNNSVVGRQNGLNISNIEWTTVSAGDSRARSVFRRGSGCSADVEVQRAFSTAGCGGNVSVPSVTLRFLGQFSCDGLSSTNAGSVNARNAKFFCEVAKVAQCPGGSGGDGGGPAPPPQ
jgi:hypothetical protein